MKGYKEFSSIQLCTKPIDLRKGIYSLASFIEYSFNEKPFSGTLFLFTNKSRKNIKAIYWDKTGFAMWYKALEKEKFPWPEKSENTHIVLTKEQIKWLLDGINPWKIKTHKELHYSIIT